MDLLVIICCVAALSLGSTFLAPYYLATVTTLMLLVRCVQTNNKNKRYQVPTGDRIEVEANPVTILMLHEQKYFI